MEIVQHNFRAESKGWFFFTLLSGILFFTAFLNAGYETIPKTIFNIIGGVFLLSITAYGIYCFSFVYEFREKEIVIESLFGLLKKKVYPLKDLKEIEYIINKKGIIDTVSLHFQGLRYQQKISISMFQADPGKVKLFLLAHVENMKEIENETYRKWG